VFSVSDFSTMNVTGFEFNFPFGDLSATSGALVGTLIDGSAFASLFGLPRDFRFSRALTATITLRPPEPTPLLRPTKDDALLVDHNGDSRADPGDSVRYTIEIVNAGNGSAQGVVLSDTPDSNSSLIAGSVTTSQGDVVSGNGVGDTSVEVDLGTIPAETASTQVVFEVLVNDPFPPGILMIANQGELRGDNIGIVLTDDPSTLTFPEPTITEVANTELDICERDLAQCTQDLTDVDADLMQCQDDLSQCQSIPAFVDEDADGEHDPTDACPATPAGAEVDQAGCSLAQFCLSVSAPSASVCNKSDWQNDEPLGNPKDCTFDRVAGLCAPL
jgi:uncharacterized repeat protein (TIGR01451 family)